MLKNQYCLKQMAEAENFDQKRESLQSRKKDEKKGSRGILQLLI